MSQKRKGYNRRGGQPNYDRNDGLPGVVYILHNEAMRVGIYKVGQSTRSGGHRARDLNCTVGTETPKMFKCIFEQRTVDCGRAEKAVHERLKDYRLTSQEYFEVDLELAKLVVIEECAKQVPAAPQVIRAEHIPTPPSPSHAVDSRLLERDIRNEIQVKQAEWKRKVVGGNAAAGNVEGLKWGCIWFVGSALFFSMLGTKAPLVWVALCFGLIAYFINRQGPANRILSSQDARDAMARIESEVRQNAQLSSVKANSPVRPLDEQEAREKRIEEENLKASPAVGSLSKDQETRSKLIAEGKIKTQLEIPTPQSFRNVPWKSYLNAGGPNEIVTPAPILEKYKVVCPKCRLVLVASMEFPHNNQKIQCPKCQSVFTFGERFQPATEQALSKMEAKSGGKQPSPQAIELAARISVNSQDSKNQSIDSRGLSAKVTQIPPRLNSSLPNPSILLHNAKLQQQLDALLQLPNQSVNLQRQSSEAEPTPAELNLSLLKTSMVLHLLEQQDLLDDSLRLQKQPSESTPLPSEGLTGTQ